MTTTMTTMMASLATKPSFERMHSATNVDMATTTWCFYCSILYHAMIGYERIVVAALQALLQHARHYGTGPSTFSKCQYADSAARARAALYDGPAALHTDCTTRQSTTMT